MSDGSVFPPVTPDPPLPPGAVEVAVPEMVPAPMSDSPPEDVPADVAED